MNYSGGYHQEVATKTLFHTLLTSFCNSLRVHDGEGMVIINVGVHFNEENTRTIEVTLTFPCNDRSTSRG